MLSFFNTLSRQVEEFHPLEGNKVRLYMCGPTVWNFAHIGNFRTFIFGDVLRRYLKHKGYELTHVFNLTDVDDRIINESAKQNINIDQFTAPYIQYFWEDFDALGNERPEITPRATHHIPEMVKIISKLLENGHAYESDGSIYYRISAFPDYGKLSKINFSGNIAGGSERVDTDKYEKEDARDFALWKLVGADEQPGWDAPIGRGRPGWHIECSAMSMKYLGLHFDMHTGGEDNIFPHHENEIAQSEAATGEPFVNYWLHCRHLLVDNQKMSKSLGNFYTLRDLLEKGFKPKAIRYALLSIHYRQSLNFTFEGLYAAEQAVQRLTDFLQHLPTAQGEGFEVQPLLAETQQRFEDALDDDLNISGALGAIFEMVRAVNRAMAQHQLSAAGAEQVATLMYRFDTVLGLLVEERPLLARDVEALMEERQRARQARDFARADALRAQIQERGYVVEDTPQGPRLKRL
jgi:cysteinyl-tRNA synthetase